MFAYCGNNPINFCDITGNYAGPAIRSICAEGSGPRKLPGGFRGGNYSNHNMDDLAIETMQIHENISRSQANYYYDTIRNGDYGQLLAFDPLSGLIDLISSVFNIGDYAGLVYDTIAGFSSMGYSDVLDPEGRLLYVEEGYNIIILYRVFIGDGYSGTEREYFIFDQQWDLVFNDVISTSRSGD